MSALVAAVSAGNTNGASLTTSAIDTTGANLILIAVAGVFSNGAVSDSKSNTWTQISGSTTHNTGFSLFYCFNPTVGSGHTFTQGADGSAFSECISVAAFSGHVQVSSSSLDGGRVVAAADPPTAMQGGSRTPSVNNAIYISVGVTEQGSGVPTVGNGLTIASQGGGGSVINSIAIAYLFQGTAAALNPLWTVGTGNTHWGVLNQVFYGTAISVPLTATANDSFTFTDAVNGLMAGLLTLSETLSFSDTLANDQSIIANPSDSITFSDDVSNILGIVLTLSDALTFLDGFSNIITLALSTSDSFGFSDNLIPYSLGLLFHLSDNLSLADTLTANPVYSELLQDGFSLTDAFTAKLYINSLLSELLVFADANKIDLKDLVSTSDAVTFADAVQFAVLTHLERTTADSFAFTDEVKTLLPGPSDDYLRRYLNDKIR